MLFLTMGGTQKPTPWGRYLSNYQMPIQGVTLFSGGGGLISSAKDYLIFCEMLRQGGSYGGVRFLGP